MNHIKSLLEISCKVFILKLFTMVLKHNWRVPFHGNHHHYRFLKIVLQNGFWKVKTTTQQKTTNNNWRGYLFLWKPRQQKTDIHMFSIISFPKDQIPIYQLGYLPEFFNFWKFRTPLSTIFSLKELVKFHFGFISVSATKCPTKILFYITYNTDNWTTEQN